MYKLEIITRMGAVTIEANNIPDGLVAEEMERLMRDVDPKKLLEALQKI